MEIWKYGNVEILSGATCTVHHALDLPAMDIGGASDPYVELRVVAKVTFLYTRKAVLKWSNHGAGGGVVGETWRQKREGTNAAMPRVQRLHACQCPRQSIYTMVDGRCA
jgi:hypothetical protein